MAVLKQKSPLPKVKSKQPAPEAVIGGTPIGDVLREAREERGISLEAIANELMIRQFYLNALEQGEFHELPERVYAIGFVRNYVTYLGLEAAPYIEQFKREAYGTRGASYQVDLSMPEPVVQSIVPGRSAIVSAIAVLVVLVAGIVFFTQGDKKPTTVVPAPQQLDVQQIAKAPETEAAARNTVPQTTVNDPASAPVADTTTEAPEFTNAVPAENAPAATADAAAPNPAIQQMKNRRAIEAMQSAWVEVKDAKGKTMYTGILKAGQLLPLPDNTKIGLTTGNAGGLRLIQDGQPLPAFGQVNEVKRDIVIPAVSPAPVAPSTAAVPDLKSAEQPAAMPAPKAPVAATVPASAPVTNSTDTTTPAITFER